ncbi:MAG: exodeoxyribonuclease VII small subunit [Sulfurimonas sp. RIFCSPHIGHO2_12_FULL_36_9]|jgi:exodeoxyribonuclease VII small subunit|uniref:exodeoxyribonuclease VII small subunit n=1 Tax=unclassified Sulfurimonas TaxID=2623549 RepID=UPI0008C1321C|nr:MULTISPECIES: exodeoxyribonuclease VII small subunit [unclassified Sulfurimonas]OHD99399.1 MAG: exodeoxyribonuclease VII small subunit [Sulfurimonas sp. RIFCSPHIGHO2_12_FULL_36_9]OHE02378.1 MAG: exodeoxyribonuclease VII small subunit [Sulfurimonas sp. RIFCSPLOWO2_12_36_12]
MAKKTEGFTEESGAFTKEAEGFESKLESAKKVLETLMNPEITLQDSLRAYEKGMSELSQAQKILEEAQIKITEIKEK